MSRRMPEASITRACLEAHPNEPLRALSLAVDMTWWRMIVNLEVVPADDVVLPEGVRLTRDAEIAKRLAA